MKYKVTASVEGNIFLDIPYFYQKGDYTIEFHLEKNNKLKEIVIWTTIFGKDVEKYKSDMTQENGIPHFKIGGDIAVENNIRNEFQLLESNLSFISLGILRKIRWDDVKEEFIPETEEEKEQIKVISFRTHEEYFDRPAKISRTVLDHYVINGNKYEELAVAKAFWREGINYFRRFQYVQAFYNYFFILEGFYANRKTAENEVLKEFSRSFELSEITDQAIKHFIDNHRHGKRLSEMLKEEDYPIDRLGLQKLLFKMRGRLHHYFEKTSRTYGTPFNQREFETIALICGYIANLAIGYREAKINEE